jgi:hypothetical protein
MPILFFFWATGTASFNGAGDGKRMGTTGRSTAEMPGEVRKLSDA